MKEPQFRVWDKTTKKMFVVFAINFNGAGIKSVRILGKVPNTSSSYSTPNDRLIASRIELMQSTGVKSIDDEKVFDGDILKFPDLENYYVVGWSDEESSFVIRYKEHVYFKMGMCQFMQVAGNIYESEDLVS